MIEKPPIAKVVGKGKTTQKQIFRFTDGQSIEAENLEAAIKLKNAKK